jgi:putative nucleotidyltransferase with HDIG domain
MPNDRILVVDDEETIREIVSSMLSGAHFQTRQAGSGIEALAALESGEEFDLVLSDLMMAEMDGIALLERAKERYPDMPIVMVTAVHDIQVALQALRNGAYDYLLKPFEREQLLATVRRAMENRRLKRENDAYRTNLEALVAARTQQWKTALSDLEKSYDITLEALGDALDLKDAETYGHTRRVTAFAIAMARKMGLSKEEINVIARGAFLHDIGKMAIRDDILRKPGKLTAEEMAIMMEHCYLGYKIISRIPFLAEAAEIVYAHQEHYDGSGYPRGLKGDEIPLGARIFAIADTLDAMRSDRPYRDAQSIQAVRKEIETWSGRQFDPQVVKVFLEMPDNIWEDLRNDINDQNPSFPKGITWRPRAEGER